MKDSSLNRHFDDFLSQIETFADSVTSPTGLYYTDHLHQIIREKQVLEICNHETKLNDEFNAVSKALSAIVSDLVGGTVSNGLLRYKEQEEIIEDRFSGNFYLYTKQTALSVKSLYYYKINSLKRAFSATLECLSLNEYLLRCGIFSLLFRCVEQNRNLAKIFLREQNTRLAYPLLFNIFNYLFNGKADGLYGTVFNENFIWNKNTALRESYCYELFLLTAEDILKINQKSESFIPTEWYINLSFEVDTRERQYLYNWIFINDQLRKENFKEYFDGLLYYFQEPINTSYDILKISLLHDLNCLADQSGFPNKDCFKKKVREFVSISLSKYKNYNEILFNLPC
jgi:hypothetical protein